jgi:hypothetical protein
MVLEVFSTHHSTAAVLLGVIGKEYSDNFRIELTGFLVVTFWLFELFFFRREPSRDSFAGFCLRQS